MIVRAALLEQLIDACREASREASEARESDCAALVGCQEKPGQGWSAEFQQQVQLFQDLEQRLADWQPRLAEGQPPLSPLDKQRLLGDLRLVLTAIRIVAFDIGLHGRGANMTDTEIADEVGKLSRLDCQLRAHVIPPLKIELGVTDTVAI